MHPDIEVLRDARWEGCYREMEETTMRNELKDALCPACRGDEIGMLGLQPNQKHLCNSCLYE